MDTSSIGPTAESSVVRTPSRQSWRRATVSGYAWSIVTHAARSVSQFVVMALLARSLRPEEIGTVGLTLVVINILMVVNEVGLGGGIIQRERLPVHALSTLFWLGWGLALLQFGLLQGGAGVWATFTHNEAVVPVMRWLSIGVLFEVIGVVPRSLLMRAMEFRKVAIQEMVASLVASFVTVALAWAGYGLWSLVAWTLIQMALRALLSFWLSGWCPQRVFHIEALSEFWSFGAYYALTRLSSTVARNLDFVIVGKLVSTDALGFYTLAFNLSRIPPKLLARIVDQVAFPAFARIQADQDLGQKTYLLQLTLMSTAILPFSLVLLAFPDQLVGLIYGPGWIETAQLLRILAITATLASLEPLRGSVLLGNGRAAWLLYLNMARTTMLGLAVLIGALTGGMRGVAWAVTGHVLVSFFAGQTLVNLTVGTTMAQVSQALWPGIIAALAMAATMGFSSLALTQMSVEEPIVVAALSVLAGGVAYVACLMSQPLYRRILQVTVRFGYAALIRSFGAKMEL